MKTYLIILSMFLVFNINSQTIGNGVTDIDGNYYGSVIIGTQEWLTDNLNTSRYSNGDSIPNLSVSDWQFAENGAWRNYNDDDSLSNIYGKLYNYYTVVDERNVCPDGWMVGDLNEWEMLVNYLDGGSVAGGKMKTTGILEDNTGLWLSPNSGATNSSNFSAIPSGYLNWGGTSFNKLNEYAYYWTTTEGGNISSAESESVRLYNTNDNCDFTLNKRTTGFAIRCMRDYTTVGTIQINNPSKNLIQILDMMGRETTFKPNTTLIYIYDDGSTEKVFKIE